MVDYRDITRNRLQIILSRISGLKAGVLGDLGLDAFWYADMTRSFLSRETPHFARPILRERYAPGAGANVAHNLIALGIDQVEVFSVLGEDWRGALLRQEISKRGIGVDKLISSTLRSTTAFIRPILMGYNSQQEAARLDFENAKALPGSLEDALLDTITKSLPDLDCLLIADQLDVNGIVTDRVRGGLNALAAREPLKIMIVDSRQNIGLFRNMVLKPNWVEATQAVYPGQDPHYKSYEDLAQCGGVLSQRTGRPVFITLSEEGVLVCDQGDWRHIPAAPVHPPLDPVGAGDAFVAALGAALAAGATGVEAGILANLAAAVTVEKLEQTGTASPDEILERFELAMHLNG